MKHKFLITNDIGIALDKVNSVISVFRSENFTTEYLYELDEVLIETLSHLQQALDNLDSEEDA